MAATRTARKTTTAKADGRTHTGRTGPLVPVDPYANTSHSMRRHVGLRFEQITVGAIVVALVSAAGAGRVLYGASNRQSDSRISTRAATALDHTTAQLVVKAARGQEATSQPSTTRATRG